MAGKTFLALCLECEEKQKQKKIEDYYNDKILTLPSDLRNTPDLYNRKPFVMAFNNVGSVYIDDENPF